MAVSSISSIYGDWSQDILEALAKQRESDDTSEDVAKQTVKSLDRNADSSLTMQESGLSQAAFSAADKDGDGKLSVQELADALATERAKIAVGLADSDDPDGVANSLIKQLDTMDQMDGVAGKLMTLLDRDGDSGLSLKESGLTKEAFAQVDADGDGVISQDELTNALTDERRAAESTTSSNAGSTKLFDALLRQAGLNQARDPRKMRKALQAYGSNILMSALSQSDGDSDALSVSSFLGGSQAQMLGLMGNSSTDASGTDTSQGLAGLLDSSI
jgi:Ca2+-binding EF-hand superfamily protein